MSELNIQSGFYNDLYIYPESSFGRCKAYLHLESDVLIEVIFSVIHLLLALQQMTTRHGKSLRLLIYRNVYIYLWKCLSVKSASTEDRGKYCEFFKQRGIFVWENNQNFKEKDSTMQVHIINDNNYYLLSAYYAWDTILNILHVLTDFNLTITLWVNGRAKIQPGQSGPLNLIPTLFHREENSKKNSNLLQHYRMFPCVLLKWVLTVSWGRKYYICFTDEKTPEEFHHITEQKIGRLRA